VDDLPGIDQPRDYFAADAESKVALHASADSARELATVAFSRSRRGDPHQRRFRARVDVGSAAAGEEARHDGDDSGGSLQRRYRHASFS
jgi:hypothetical protein